MCFLGTQPNSTSNVFTLEVRFLMLQKPKIVEKTLKDGLGKPVVEAIRTEVGIFVLLSMHRGYASTFGPTVPQTESLFCDGLAHLNDSTLSHLPWSPFSTPHPAASARPGGPQPCSWAGGLGLTYHLQHLSSQSSSPSFRELHQRDGTYHVLSWSDPPMHGAPCPPLARLALGTPTSRGWLLNLHFPLSRQL